MRLAGPHRILCTGRLSSRAPFSGQCRLQHRQETVAARCNRPHPVQQALEEPAFNRFLEILRSDPKPDRGLRTLLSRLDELDDYGFFRVNESQRTLWDNDEPTIIRVHTTQNDNLQRAFAALVFYSLYKDCLLYTSPSPRDGLLSRMPSSA